MSSTTVPAPTPTGYPWPPAIPDDPDTADRNCRLLGPFALFVQTVMGFVVVGTLVLKRQREKPKRPWKIWSLDISKQMLGQLFVHTLNVALSSLGSLASEGMNNPCSLYFLNIAIDTTAGVLFIYYSMRFLTHYFTDILGWPGFVSGQYMTTPTVLGRRRRRRLNETSFDGSVGSPVSETDPINNGDASIQGVFHQTQQSTASSAPTAEPHPKKNRPRLTFFFRQLSLYLFSLLLMKIMVVLLFAIFPFLFDVGRWVLGIFGEHKKAQIFFVMAAFPLAMNTLQFWLIDSLLRHNPLTSIYSNEEEAHAAGAQLQGTDSEAFRDSTTSGAASSDQRRSSWWRNSLQEHPHQQHRSDEGARSRLMGDMDDSNRDDGDEPDDEHAYPPTPSATSSVAHLDSLKAGDVINEPSTTDAAPSDSQKQKGTVEEPTTRISQEDKQRRISDQRQAAAGEANEEEDAWDNWDEDNVDGKNDEHVNSRPS